MGEEGVTRVATAILCCGLLAGCAAQVTGFADDKVASAAVSTAEATVDENGGCPAGLVIDPSTFRGREGDGLIGMTECELVAMKGAPLSVQTGASSTHKRETMLLYFDPASGKTIYLFADNRLVRIVRGSDPAANPG
jgi:hypothetical protein